MKKAIGIILIAIFAIIGNNPLLSQKAYIHKINSTGYPKVKLEYTLWDIDGREARRINNNEIILTENSKPLNFEGPFCGEAGPTNFSAILIVDISLSMTRPISDTDPRSCREIMLDVVRQWINDFDINRAETAITLFAKEAHILHDFSADRTSLLNAINNIPNYEDGTNYNAAFLSNTNNDSTNSALDIAKNAKYKPVIVFLTDGSHNPLFIKDNDYVPFELDAAIKLAKIRDAYIFCVKIGTEKLDQINLHYLRSLATVEGNIKDNLFAEITDADSVSKVFSFILEKAGNLGIPPRCYITWDANCSSGGDLKMKFLTHYDYEKDTTYSIPTSYKPYLEITQRDLYFEIFDFSHPYDMKATVKARNHDIDIASPSYQSSNGKFIIKDWGDSIPPFTLKKDSATDITVTYSPSDESFQEANIEIFSNACDSSWFYASSSSEMKAIDVDMGISGVGVAKFKKIDNLLCNKTNKTLYIDSIRIIGGDESDFSISPKFDAQWLLPGECIVITFKFKPGLSGKRSSKIEIFSDKSSNPTFRSNIFGDGESSGIESVSSVNFPNADCSISTRELNILLKNTGDKTLNIFSCKPMGNNQKEFKINSYPQQITGRNTDSITIAFLPSCSGTFTAIVEIVSDDTKNPVYNIQIQGIKDSVDFTLSDYSLNLGDICIGEPITKLITLANVGTKSVNVFTDLPQGFSLPNEPIHFWNLTLNEIKDLLIEYIPDTEGPINKKIYFFEDLCDTVKSIIITGNVLAPRLECSYQPPLPITSTLSNYSESVLIVTNTSSYTDITITDATLLFNQYGQFSVVNAASLPITIQAGKSHDLIVRYSPNTAHIDEDSLLISTSTCSYAKIIPLLGNPSLSMVDIRIDDYEKLIGESVDIPIYLRNPLKFLESSTSSISTVISFDATMLEQQQPAEYPETVTGGIRSIELKDIPVNAVNSDQTLETLHLIVTDSPNLSTTLDISQSTKSDKDNVSFIIKNGSLSIIPASAILEIGSDSARAGEYVNIPVKIRNAKNITDFHEGIITQLKFKSVILEPANKELINNGQALNGNWIIALNLPVKPQSADSVLQWLPFRAMLGSAKETELVLENPISKKGKIDFTVLPGKFKLLGICEEGGARLFDPTDMAGITIPSDIPSSQRILIQYETIERGLTTIRIIDLLGGKVFEHIEQAPKPGVHELEVNTENFSSGLFFVTMQTPTQFFVKKMMNVK